MCLSCVTMLQQDRTCTWRMVPCGTSPPAVVSVVQCKLSSCASLLQRSCTTALTVSGGLTRASQDPSSSNSANATHGHREYLNAHKPGTRPPIF